MVVVDFTHPTAANSNVKAYCAAGIDFVIGTTGGSVDEMVRGPCALSTADGFHTR